MGRILLALLTFAAAATSVAAEDAEQPAAAVMKRPQVEVAKWPQAIVNFKVIDVDLSVIRKVHTQDPFNNSMLRPSPLMVMVGLTPKEFEEMQSGARAFTMSKNDAGFGLLDALLKREMATVVEDPSLQVELGRAGEYFTGGSFKVPDDSQPGGKKTVKYGTEITATVTERDQRALVGFNLRISDLDESHQQKIGGTVVPAVKTFESSTTVSVKWGETAVIGGLVQLKKVGRGREHEIQRLILITPSLIDEKAADVARKRASPDQILPGREASLPTLRR